LKNATNYFIEAKIHKLTESVIPHQTMLHHQLGFMYGLPPNMKSSSHKMWQASLLFLKPLQIQNLKRKTWGDIAYYVPPVWKSGGTRPPCPPPNCAHAHSTRVYRHIS